MDCFMISPLVSTWKYGCSKLHASFLSCILANKTHETALIDSVLLPKNNCSLSYVPSSEIHKYIRWQKTWDTVAHPYNSSYLER